MINFLTISKYIIIATVIAVIWMIIARKEYRYNKKIPEIFGISIFPLIGWTLGLSAIMIIYDYIEYKFLLLSQIFVIQLIIFCIIYWILLLFAETVGYHIFNIHNENAAKYKGIPILNCLHAVWWMKIAYFVLGPIMFLTCRLL